MKKYNKIMSLDIHLNTENMVTQYGNMVTQYGKMLTKKCLKTIIKATTKMSQKFEFYKKS